MTYQDVDGGYQGTQDLRLEGGESVVFGADQVSSNGSPRWIHGRPLNSKVLMRFDLTEVTPLFPAARLQSASLVLKVTERTKSRYDLHAVVRDWRPKQVTWNQPDRVSGSARWGDGVSPPAGGGLVADTDRNPTSMGVVGPADALATLSYPLNDAGIATVQAWIDSPSTNHGMVVDSNAGGDLFGWVGDAFPLPNLRPKLTLGFVGGTVVTLQQGSTVASSSTGEVYDGGVDAVIAQGDDPHTVNFNKEDLRLDGKSSGSSVTLIRFDIDAGSAEARVTDVSLSFSALTGIPASYPLYALKVAWAELAATYDSPVGVTSSAWSAPGLAPGPDFDPAPLGVLSVTTPGRVNVVLNPAGLAAVQSWVSAPKTNFGFVLRNPDQSVTVELADRESVDPAQRPSMTMTYDPAGPPQYPRGFALGCAQGGSGDATPGVWLALAGLAGGAVCRRRRRGAGALVFALVGASVAHADLAGGRREVEDGDRLLLQGRARPALEAFRRALGEPQLTREILVRAYAGVGTAASLLGQRETSRDAFRRVFALSPPWRLASHTPVLDRDVEAGRAFWAGRAPFKLELQHPAHASAEVDFSLRAAVASDPLRLVHSFRMSWRAEAASGEVRAYGSPAVLNVPGRLLHPGARLDLFVEALDEHRSVVGDAPVVTLPVGPAPPVLRAPAPLIVMAPRPRDHLHAQAALSVPVVHLGLGGEVGLAYSVTSILDVGLAAIVGRSLGVQLGLTLHGSLARERGWHLFAQPRVLYLPGSGLPLFAGGAWLGATLALGPGRLMAGPAGELYRPVAGFEPWDIFMLLGYELDVL